MNAHSKEHGIGVDVPLNNQILPFFVVGQSYLDRQGEYLVTSITGDQISYKRADGQEHRADARLKAHIQRSVLAEQKAPTPFREMAQANGDPGPFQQGILQEVFWWIAQIVRERATEADDWISHDSLVSALIAHPDAGPLLNQRSERDPEWFASDYIAFYSREWTLGRPRHADTIERTKIGGDWAYRARS